MSVIDEVKQKTDIVEIIGQHARLTKSGRNFRALCPFHNEKQPSFFVYPEQQSWHCFGACSTGGDVLSFVMKKQGIEFGEALRLLAERAGVTITSRPEETLEQKEKDRLYQVNEAAAIYFHNLLLSSPAAEKARAYVAGRGLTAKTVADFGLGYSLANWEALGQHLAGKGYSEAEQRAAGLVVEAESGQTHDRFRHRLMFPIRDVRGHAIGFGARALDPEAMPKYLNSPQTAVFDKSASLYGISMAAGAIRQLQCAVIVEGYFDAIMAHQAGFSNVVASMGTSLTDKRLSDTLEPIVSEDPCITGRQLSNAIKRLTRNTVLALDADAAGQEAMLRWVGYENTLGAEVRVVILPEGKDPDEVIRQDPKAWEELVAQAAPVLDFAFQEALKGLDVTKAQDKAEVVARLLPLLAEMADNTRRDHYLTMLQKATGTDYRHLEADLAKVASDKKLAASKGGRSVTSVARSVRPVPLEEYFLALVLRHAELKPVCAAFPPEYFENTENREIFLAWQRTGDAAELKDSLDPAIREHLDGLVSRSLPETEVAERYQECALRLRENYLRAMESRRAALLALEREAGGTAAELAKQQEQGIETSVELGKVFAQKGQRKTKG